MDRSQLTGFVLAGGKSTRMGSDKALLSIKGRSLLEMALDTVRQVANQVFILGFQTAYAKHAPVIPDIYPGCGPLSGIHAALTRTKTEYNVIIGVDTPFLSAALLTFLAERALAARAVVTAPEINGYPQPLCAVYSREFLPIAERALQAGNYKIVPLFPGKGTLLISQAELAQVAFTPDMFENLNTPKDLEAALQREPAKKP